MASQSPQGQADNNDILLVHLGGLGDTCLSESLFFSSQKHFGNCLIGLGNKRFLSLFEKYFLRVEGVESRKWLYLFSDKLVSPRWKQIIFIGKDREGILRNRWQKYSEEKLIFIDMYSEKTFSTEATLDPENIRKIHIEDYQLSQLALAGVEPFKKTIPSKKSSRIILYPEKGFEKEKWHFNNFLALYKSLVARDFDVTVLESLGLTLNIESKVSLQKLTEIKIFFSEGGIFVSNDSGMAHLAGVSGLFTITIFTGFDPAIWHPRGNNISLLQGQRVFDPSYLESIILNVINNTES